MIWWFMTAAAVAALIGYWGGPNAVWGTATLGVVVGLVIAVIQPGFDWSIIGKAGVLGALTGLAFEWLPRIASRMTK